MSSYKVGDRVRVVDNGDEGEVWAVGARFVSVSFGENGADYLPVELTNLSWEEKVESPEKPEFKVGDRVRNIFHGYEGEYLRDCEYEPEWGWCRMEGLSCDQFVLKSRLAKLPVESPGVAACRQRTNEEEEYLVGREAVEHWNHEKWCMANGVDPDEVSRSLVEQMTGSPEGGVIGGDFFQRPWKSVPFDVKDSGVREEYASGMVRDTEKGKPRFDLLLPKGVPFEEQFLTRFAAHMAKGAEKYTDRNWEKAEGQEELDRYHSSALRHLLQWIAGKTDEDHAAAVAFNLLAGTTVEFKMRAGE